MQAIETYEYQGFTIEIHYDDYPMNPRVDFDTLGTMILEESNGWHRRDNYSDKGAPSVDAIPEIIADPTTVYLCLWSSSHGPSCNVAASDNVYDESTHDGIIYIERAKWQREYGWKRLTASRREQIQDYLKGEIKTYSQYRNGEVYGYIVLNADDENIDSCWGYYGDIEYCKSEAESAANYHVDQAVETFNTYTEAFDLFQATA